MPPAPLLTTLSPVLTGVVANPTVSLGKNFSVTNSATGVKTTLPITTSTVITSQGLNINPTGGANSKLTINDSGDINSAGALSLAGSVSAASVSVTGSLSGANASVTGSVSAASLGIGSNNNNFVVESDGGLKIKTTQFTVTSAGVVNAVGTLSTDAGLNVNAGRFKVASGGNLYINTAGAADADATFSVESSSGNVKTKGQLEVTGDFKVNSSQFTVSGAGATSGDVKTVGGFSAANTKFVVARETGILTTKSDLKSVDSSGADSFKVTAETGAVVAKGSLTAASASINGSATVAAAVSAASLAIGTDKTQFTVSAAGAVFATGSVSAASASVTNAVSAASLAIGTDKTQFTVSAAGAVVAAGSLSATSLAISSSNFTVSSAGAVVAAGAASIAGDLKIANKFIVSSNDGSATSAIPYAGYTLAACATNTTTTTASGAEPVMTSATSAYLTTQEYVDKQLWNQTKRINTILGSDSTVVDSFNNVYNLVTKFAGESSTVATLNNITGKYDTLVDRAAEIVTSVSDVVAQAYNTVLVNCAPSVWADECGPVPIPASITQKTTEDGWFFTNYVGYDSTTLVKGNKINWYVPVNGADMTIGDIKNLYMNIFAASNMSLPLITVYTQPKKDANNVLDPNNYATWAGAKITYVYSAASPTLDANQSYCLYTNKSPMNVYGKTRLSPSDVATANKLNRYNGTEGVLSTASPKSYDTSIVSETDKILYIAVNSASTAAANNVNFILNSLNVCLKTGTTNFAFSNAGVTSNYLFNYFFSKNIDFSAFPSPAKQGPYVEQYNAIVYPPLAV